MDQWTVTVSVRPDAPFAQVCLSGGIDFTAEAALTEAAEQLRGAARPTIVDVGGVTFACATLTSFLVRVHNDMPPDAPLVISRATAQTRRLLALTGLESIVVVDPTAGGGIDGTGPSLMYRCPGPQPHPCLKDAA